MIIDQLLISLINEINNNIERKESLHQSLQDYEKRRLVLNIKGEANYVFKINANKISFKKKVEIEDKDGDINISLGSELAEEILKTKKIRLRDIPRIKHRNIKIQDIILGKKIIYDQ